MIDFERAVHQPAEPGHGRHGRLGDEQVARQHGARCPASWSEHGVDAIRLTMVFAGPPEDDIDWADVSPHGSARFLARAARLAATYALRSGADPTTGDVALRKVTHRSCTT